MQKQLLPEAEGYARTNVRRRIWRRFVRVMACIVVFCTTYALILPAITLEREGVCELEEHTHSDACYSLQTAQEVARLSCTLDSLQIHTHTRDCYGADNELLCGFADFVVHEHSGACFDAAGNLVCTLPVVREHEHTDECYEPVHVHTEDCYIPEGELICELEEVEAHSHDETCAEAVLVCELTVEPHEHTDGCYEQLVCQLPEDENHTHDDSCSGLVLVCGLTEQPHTHDESCYETEYVCGLEETEGHTHEESCYASEETLICEEEEAAEGEDPRGELICQEEEIVLHIHDDDCYEITKDAEGNEIRILICQELEIREHVHDESCFVTETVELDTQTLTCTETDETHEHTDRCYGTWVLTCELEEHTHTEECTALLGLSEEDRAEVEKVIALIEPLPTYDELAAKLDEFYEADDTEGEEAYLMEVYAQVEDAYRAYMALDDSLREYVTNADKLMDLEFIWSQITLEEIHTADAREDDIPVVVGDGISFRLFDYSLDINKDSTKTAWRPISAYFNFRDSSGLKGNDPTTANTTNLQMAEHDIDGFTKHHSTVERKLDANRNPILDLSRNADGSARTTDPGWSQEQRSLGYLFSDQGDHAVTAYYPYNTILQKSGNHYWYDSKDNAVDYDISTGAFRVRNYVERAPSTAAYKGYSDFMPFTYTGGKSVGTNESTNVDYHAVYADVNYWYGMTMDVSFFQTKDGQIDGGDMIFNFSGDDDVWVFVDDVLVLDLGGTHGTATGSINFATGEVVQYLSWSGGTADNTEGDSATSFPTTIRACFDAAGATPNGGWSEDGKTFADYTEHTLKFFYMERGAAVANCKLDFRLPTLPDKSLTVTKDLVIDGDSAVKDFLEDTLVYKFRVMKADAEGNATNEFFVTPGMTYTILDGGTAAGTGTVASDGTFSLRPGQSAQFTDMLVKGGGAVEYVVQEIIPENLAGQYGGIEYEVSGAPGSVESEGGELETFLTYSTGKLSAESTQTVVYRNKVNTANLSFLKLTKALAPSAKFEEGKIFRIQVKLGGQLLPVGTEYLIDGESEPRQVTEPGIIELKIDQTAMILDGIISGTEFEVTELGSETGGFTPSYSGTITADGQVTNISCTANGASGTFPLSSVAHVTVTNANYDFSGQIPIYKQALDNSDTATFSFLVEQGTWENGVWTKEDSIPGTSITVNDAAEHPGTITIGYDKGTNATFYYKIYEQRGTGDYVYDTSYYIVEVEVTAEGAGGMGTATVKNIWKNGTELTKKILFTNIKTTSLMVSKRVTGALSNGTFDFRAVVVDQKGQPFNLPDPTDGSYTVEGNVAIFKLSAGQSIEIKGIPYGAKVTVTETQHDGFVAYYQVSGVHDEQQLGDSVVVTFANGVQTVTFINDGGYELPDTGGAGTYLYTMGGALLTCAAILLYIHILKRRKEERPSF